MLLMLCRNRIRTGSGDAPDPGTSYKPYRIFNIGNNNPVELTQFIEAIENALGKKAKKDFMDIQPGDVAETYANIDDLYEAVGFKPETSIEEGLVILLSGTVLIIKNNL